MDTVPTLHATLRLGTVRQDQLDAQLQHGAAELRERRGVLQRLFHIADIASLRNSLAA